MPPIIAISIWKLSSEQQSKNKKSNLELTSWKFGYPWLDHMFFFWCLPYKCQPLPKLSTCSNLVRWCFGLKESIDWQIELIKASICQLKRPSACFTFTNNHINTFHCCRAIYMSILKISWVSTSLVRWANSCNSIVDMLNIPFLTVNIIISQCFNQNFVSSL